MSRRVTDAVRDIVKTSVCGICVVVVVELVVIVVLVSASSVAFALATLSTSVAVAICAAPLLKLLLLAAGTKDVDAAKENAPCDTDRGRITAVSTAMKAVAFAPHDTPKSFNVS